MHLAPPAIPAIWWGIKICGLSKESPDPSAFPTWVGRSLFSGGASHIDMVNTKSVFGIKLDDFGVLIRYQVDECTHTWLLEHFFIQFYFPGFTGKVSTLTHFPLELDCEDYSFLDQAVGDFEQGFVSILIDSTNMPELDASLDRLMSCLLQSLHGPLLR